FFGERHLTQIRIDEVTKSKSGKAWAVKSGKSWYAASLDSGIERHKGRTIDAETQPFGQGGEAIKSYKLIDLGPATPLPSASQMLSAPFWLPFASNVCAHAIDKGLISGPEGIKAWLLAAKQAAEAATGNDVTF